MSNGVREPAIETVALTKSYKSGDAVVEAVRGIDLRVEAGQTYGFLGPNGAGKSTTIEMLCTIRNPTSGTARVAGFDVVRERDQVRRRIGLVFQQQTLDQQLTAEQNLRFHADLYGLPRAEAARRIDEVLEMVALADRRKDVVLKFSGGMKRRLEIARGLVHAPQVLFLDEPTIGLDPQTRAVGAQEAVGLARLDTQVDAADRFDGAIAGLVGLGQPRDLDRGLSNGVRHAGHSALTPLEGQA